MTEQQLIEGVIAREREAITCLVDTYKNKVIRIAYYFLGNMDDAEDLSQDIFLEIMDSIGKFRRSSSLSTWIYRISVNYALNAVKRNKQRQIFTRLEHLFGITDGADGQSTEVIAVDQNVMDEDENRMILKNALSSLPENQRKVFILAKYEDLSYRDISDITGLSVSSVESLMFRARHNLQKRLVRHFKE